MNLRMIQCMSDATSHKNKSLQFYVHYPVLVSKVGKPIILVMVYTHDIERCCVLWITKAAELEN